MKVTVDCFVGGNPTITPTVKSRDEYGQSYSTQDYRGVGWDLPKKINWGGVIRDASKKWNEAAAFFSDTVATKVGIGILTYPALDAEFLIVKSHGYGTSRGLPTYGWFKTPPKHESRVEVVRRMIEVNMTAQLARWLTS